MCEPIWEQPAVDRLGPRPSPSQPHPLPVWPEEVSGTHEVDGRQILHFQSVSDGPGPAQLLFCLFIFKL